MEYTKLSFNLDVNADVEVVSALLHYHGVEAIWEDEDFLHAYFEDLKIESEDQINKIAEDLKPYILDYSKSKDKQVNWNREWESNFSPVEVDQTCFIYANFHEKKDGFKNYIKIAPKMAFGTGHHETTYMMIQAMRELDLVDREVLDLGCGTGILAVYAKQRGAGHVDAIDIEIESYKNSIEHAALNNVSFNVIHGSVENVPDRKYGLVLANINRHVLLTYGKQIIALLSEGGTLLVSGILLEDEKLIKQAYSALREVSLQRRGKWTCFQFSQR